MSRRRVVAVFIFLSIALSASPEHTSERRTRVVTIGVLALFHPRQLHIAAPESAALVVHAGERWMALERSSGGGTARILLVQGNVVVRSGGRTLAAQQIAVSGRQGHAVEFELSVPGKIRRRYRGTLAISVAGAELRPVITMDLDDAVASVVAAESSPDAPLEATKAQALAARSYFVAARGRHLDFDFCDTTHCQFLREIPSAASNAAKATEATRGLVLVYRSQPFAAMYTRSCSGHTHTPEEVKLPAGTYPYFGVECEYCLRHPARWQSQISARDAATLHAHDEPSRLKLARRVGWSTVPSNDFVTEREGESVMLTGVGQGHGIGLCQAGAKAMAESGADFRRILAHYYPNTSVEEY